MSVQGSQYMEALSLDANLLSLVIERNRKQHCRAAYFRRLDMLIRSMKRYRITDLNSDTDNNNDIRHIAPSLQELIGRVKENHDRMASLLERHKGIQKRRGRGKVEAEHWSLPTARDPKDKEQPEETLDPFLEDLKSLHLALTDQLPEILSRIMFAGAALYKELSRGYFAPLCTVALACISRIRVLTLRLGRDVFVQLEQSVNWLKSDVVALVASGSELEKQIGLTVTKVNVFLSRCKVEQTLFEKFIDLDASQLDGIIRKRKMERMMKRGEMYGLKISDDDKAGKGSGKEAFLDESSDPKELEKDIIGELVDTSQTIVGQDNASVEMMHDLKEKDSGDRNLEILDLLRGNSSSRSTKKRKSRTNSPEDHESRDTKANLHKGSNSDGAESNRSRSELSGGSSVRSTSEHKDEKKKKKKSKKKKKKSRDVIDEIFDF